MYFIRGTTNDNLLSNDLNEKPMNQNFIPYNAILCRYGEIAIKGKNRGEFESLLVANLREALAGLGKLRIMRERGRIFVRPKDKTKVFTPLDCQLMRERLPMIMGLTSASPCLLVPPDLAEIEKAVLDTFPAIYELHASQVPANENISYAMRARRNYKEFPLRSNELEIHFAEKLLSRYPRLQIDLENPDLRVDVEVRQRRAMIFYEYIKGPGGLPVGSGGHVLALLSGGIDSPVACIQMMKRGCSMDFVTFHSAPYTQPALLRHVAALVEILNRHQGRGRLFAVNLLPIQKIVRDCCHPRFRTILYRRFMMRIATVIARRTKAKALVTGDNFGQVASQTLSNLSVISASTSLLVLRPLLCFDKIETVRLATQFGTFEISEQAVPDSCTVFAPQNPATSANEERIKAEEAKLDIDVLLRECFEQTVVLDIETLEEKSAEIIY